MTILQISLLSYSTSLHELYGFAPLSSERCITRSDNWSQVQLRWLLLALSLRISTIHILLNKKLSVGALSRPPHLDLALSPLLSLRYTSNWSLFLLSPSPSSPLEEVETRKREVYLSVEVEEE